MPGMLLRAGHATIEPTEAEVRSTVTAVNDDAPSAEESAPPDFNQFESDPDTEGGLTRHDVAAYRVPSDRYVPPMLATAQNTGVDDINRRISSSGTAAQREEAGHWGHGTLAYSEAIEPAFPDGHQMGADYFKAERSRVVSDMLTPARSYDAATSGAAQATAAANSKDAVALSQTQMPYQALLDSYGRRA